MSRPAVFFDRDNTLMVNGDYLGDPEKVVLVAGAAEAVARVRSMGFATVVVSNQSGVARGMFSEEDVRAVNARMDKMLLDDNAEAVIERHEFCPNHPAGTVDAYKVDCDRRKPGAGMIRDAAKAMDLDLARSWLVGDAGRDVESGRRAGCRTILVRDPALASVASPAAAAEASSVPADYIASSLLDAVDFIAMHADDAVETTGVETPASSPLLTETHDPSLAPSRSASVRSESTATARATGPASRAEREQLLLLERVVEELRRGNDPPQDFSIARMMAGVVQGFALAALVAALLFRDRPDVFQMLMLLAIFLQVLVTSLALLGR